MMLRESNSYQLEWEIQTMNGKLAIKREIERERERDMFLRRAIAIN